MGLIRKTMSVSTLGAVDFKSDKERTATYTKKSAKEAKRLAQEAKKQTALLAAQARDERRRAAKADEQAAALAAHAVEQHRLADAATPPSPSQPHPVQQPDDGATQRREELRQYYLNGGTTPTQASADPVETPDSTGPSTSDESDLTSQLRQLAEMRASGVLTDNEFASAKAKLLS